MIKHVLPIVSLSLAAVACGPAADNHSQLDVTSVDHTPVKRQSIGNCWLYAAATWLESLLKSTQDKEVNVSESYWTYWDFYEKLMKNEPIPEEELNTGGSWSRASAIIKIGWVREEDFIPEEAGAQMSGAQKCAEAYVLKAGKDGGTLADLEKRTPELIREELDKAFSCDGKFKFHMDEIYEKRILVQDTEVVDPHTRQEMTLTDVLAQWKEHRVTTDTLSAYEGKKMLSAKDEEAFAKLNIRMRKALNDNYPVVISFFVSFNAPDSKGLFNIATMGEKGEIGKSGGHMVVLHDYVVDDVPGFGRLTEGDLDAELKTEALKGRLDYLVSKNSWGMNREDRPWLKDGYTRISWEYLTSRYYDEESERFRTFFRGAVLPPGY